MEASEKIAYREELKARLRRFALNLLELSKQTSFNSESKVLMNQLLRSGTSVYANYRAACRARSKAEFFSKLSIVVEEADETEMWLDLVISSKVNESDLARNLYSESLEILKIMSKARKSLSS